MTSQQEALSQILRNIQSYLFMVFELCLCELDVFLVIYLIACHTMWSFTYAFSPDTFQPMNGALTFEIGLNKCARAIDSREIYVCKCLGKFSENPDLVYLLTY